ncbi:hypothetical protein Zmor_026214 [Zophobas morio]|uniref:CCHC-type domain-containing protein n=1 Tax=Zophobas morio TaxID=2755281 RepID=A0AA38M5S8_9CUCU|nr:hypothetical protein Zmor_026214 [Zophobas morio]
MSFLRAGIQSDQYAHVMSFRRQIHVQPDDKINVPEIMVLKYENTNYRIFLAFNDIYFKCKMTGHFASDCPASHIDDDDSSSDISPLDLTRGTPGDDDPKNLIDNTDPYPLSFDKVVEFMDKPVDDGDILKLTRSYTKDVNGVLTLLYDAYPIIEKKH